MKVLWIETKKLTLMSEFCAHIYESQQEQLKQ